MKEHGTRGKKATTFYALVDGKVYKKRTFDTIEGEASMALLPSMSTSQTGELWVWCVFPKNQPPTWLKNRPGSELTVVDATTNRSGKL